MNLPDINILDPVECSTSLIVAFADTQSLAMKMAGASWNLWGTESRMVRGALTLQRDSLAEAADQIAARLSHLGVEVPSSPGKIAALSGVVDFTGYRDRHVVRTLRDDHRMMARDLRDALEECADDMATSTILAQRAAAHDAMGHQLDQILCLCGSQSALAPA